MMTRMTLCPLTFVLFELAVFGASADWDNASADHSGENRSDNVSDKRRGQEVLNLTTPAALRGSKLPAASLQNASKVPGLELGQEDVSSLSSSVIRVINKCYREPMWIATCCNYNYRQNVKIEGGGSHDFPAYAGLSGFRLWPKMRCNSDGNGCQIGQSGGRGQPCGTGGNWRCQPHIDTKFEATFGHRVDYYDMSMVDGYTLPFRLRLKGCSIPGFGSFLDCSGLSLNVCPAANKEYYNGKLLGCHARGRPGRGTREYIRLVHDVCPETYAYDLDDSTGNQNCPHGTTYELTFLCPAT